MVLHYTNSKPWSSSQLEAAWMLRVRTHVMYINQIWHIQESQGKAASTIHTQFIPLVTSGNLLFAQPSSRFMINVVPQLNGNDTVASTANAMKIFCGQKTYKLKWVSGLNHMDILPASVRLLFLFNKLISDYTCTYIQ